MELSKKTKEYWKDKDWQDLEKAKNMKDLSKIALGVLERLPEPIIEVCGPINNGGFGSFEKNIAVFNDTVIQLQEKGFNVFDQMPFEEKIQEVEKNYSSKKEWVDSIQEDFYMKIYKTNKISALYFISGWEKSNGSVWEHKRAKELGIKIVYL